MLKKVTRKNYKKQQKTCKKKMDKKGQKIKSTKMSKCSKRPRKTQGCTVDGKTPQGLNTYLMLYPQ